MGLTKVTAGVLAHHGRKNAIINGYFDIWQRGTTQTTAAIDSDDRWFNSNFSTTKVHSRQTFDLGQTDVPNNPQYYSRTVVSSVAGSSNYCVKYQKMEGVRAFSGQTVSVSFWAKADSNKDIATEFAQIFGTGGSPSAEITGLSVTTHSLTTSWQKFTIAVSIPSISGKTLGTDGNDYCQLAFWFDAGSTFDARTNSLGQQSGTFDIAQVQIEKGNTATEFEHRSISEEIALCQRYYCKSYPIDATPGLTSTAELSVCYAAAMQSSSDRYVPSVTYPNTMRIPPTVSFYPGRSLVPATVSTISQYNGNVVRTPVQLPNTTTYGMYGFFDTNNTTDDAVSFCYTADAEL